MTSLESGVKYSLSSQGHLNENKSLIFVKLTDSAARSIEDFLRIKPKIGQKPTIRFVGNEGHLHFPSSKSEHQGNFTFSLCNDQEIEGTQGGFECVQKIGPKEMESLGGLLCKMRVHANDDIFETTRSRMQAVEVSNKNKCTRVLKSNETVGKKVKVKGTVRKILPTNPTNQSTSPKQRILSAAAAAAASAAAPSLAPPAKANQSRSSAAAAAAAPSSRPQAEAPPRKNSEVMRRSLKERLIHLLALRPHKKPEIYERIHHEGIKEQEKNLISNVLKQISHMQSNNYHLHASAWNDVREDWPFYTEEERALLKTRKPQNLTPPGSSDSGSGQSPNSTDSPPRMISSSVATNAAKRSAYDQNYPQKRQRISDYRKPEVNYIANIQENVPQVQAPDLIQNIHPEHNHQVQNNNEGFLNFADQNEQPNDSDDNSNAVPDYLSDYTTILDPDQKARYKADFVQYYDDYTKLHMRMSEIAEHFTYLDRELQKKSGNEAAWEQARQEIFAEYARTKSVKLEFDYLHQKLGHIKKLVAEYDEKLIGMMRCQAKANY